MHSLHLLTFTVVFILISLCISSAKTIYVDDDGYNFRDANFTSIQEAVAYAEDGDTIIVYSGTYSPIQIEKKLILRGTGETRPVITAEGKASAVTVKSDDVIIENFYITDSGSWPEAGVKITSKNNTVSNNIISSNGYYGVLLNYSSENNTLRNNEIRNNYHGIAAYYSKNNSILNNTITDNFYGIAFYSRCNFNTTAGNSVNQNHYGMFLESSSENILRENNFTGNSFNFGVWGRFYSDFLNDIDESNSVDGGVIGYYTNTVDLIIESNAGTVYCIKCENVTVRNLEIRKSINGIFFFQTENSTIENNTIKNTWYGIKIQNACINNSIRKNVVGDNDFGIHVSSSSRNIFYLNTFVNNTRNSYSYNSFNFWNATTPLEYIYNSTKFTSYPGNYWDDYQEVDYDGNGIGDDPYAVDSGHDENPLIKPPVYYSFLPEIEKSKIEEKGRNSGNGIQVRDESPTGMSGGSSIIVTPPKVPEESTPVLDEVSSKENKNRDEEITPLDVEVSKEEREVYENILPENASEGKVYDYTSDRNSTAIIGIISLLLTMLVLILYLLRK